MDLGLKDRVAVITGASYGLGQAMAAGRYPFFFPRSGGAGQAKAIVHKRTES